MTIEDYMKIVLAFVLSHNSKYMVKKLKSEGQIEENVRPIPAELWEYYCEHYTYPRLLPDKATFIYTLCKPEKAVTSSDLPGLCVQGLYYECSLPGINAARYKHQRKRIYYDVRIDPRNTSYIYILDDEGHLILCKLIDSIPENYSYRNMTWKKYKSIQQLGKMMDKENTDYQLEHKIGLNNVVDGIVSDAAINHKGITNNTNDMLASRHREKEEISLEHSFFPELPAPVEEPENIETSKPSSGEKKYLTGDITAEDRRKQIEEIARRKMG